MQLALWLLAVLAAFPLWADAVSRDGAGRTVVSVEALGAGAGAPLLFFLADPPRAVLDLPGRDWAGPPRGAGGLAAGLRAGRAASGARLVVDLTGPARAHGLALLPGRTGGVVARLVLEEDDPARFAAQAGWPPGMGPPRRASRPLIAIDAGHGGRDPGARFDGMDEKTLTLAMARQLAAALRAAGFPTMLTRDADVYVDLDARVIAAQLAGAEAFLSLHADSAPQPHLRGATVYLGAEGRADALDAAIAAQHGDALAAALDRATSLAVSDASEALGAALVAEIGARAPLLPSRPLRHANFRVLRAPDMASALIEMGFLSSAQDRARLADPAAQAALVAGIVAGVERAFGGVDADGR